jgi:hypothetical protein
MSSLPIACTLSESELRERKATTLQDLFERVVQTRPLEAGYAFRFDASDDTLVRIMTVIQRERRCCRFMQFDRKVMPDGGPFWLTITGPDGTKAFLETLFTSR